MAVEFKDYYKTLGVARTASDDEIRKAFRKLARQYHPDVAKDKAKAEEKFKEINEAYEVLGDAEKRKKYDTLGANWNRPEGFSPPPGWGGQGRPGRPGQNGEGFEFHFGGTGFSDFFEQFFAGQAGQGRRGFSGEARAQRGEDIEGDILVSLNEALNGSIRSVNLQRTNPRTGTSETHTFRVKIPAGVTDGQTIRVPGKGETGVSGGTAGDLYLHVRLAKHPDFRVRGSDLYYDLDLAPWEAVLGATVRVPTLEGSVSVRIPPGTKQGQQLRVRAQGLPRGAEGRGDLFVPVTIETPSEVSEDEKRLWEQLAKKSDFNPRGHRWEAES